MRKNGLAILVAIVLSGCVGYNPDVITDNDHAAPVHPYGHITQEEKEYDIQWQADYDKGQMEYEQYLDELEGEQR
jgi:hypothetical protein